MAGKGLVAAARNSTHFGIVLLKSVAPSSSADFYLSGSVSLFLMMWYREADILACDQASPEWGISYYSNAKLACGFQ